MTAKEIIKKYISIETKDMKLNMKAIENLNQEGAFKDMLLEKIHDNKVALSLLTMLLNKIEEECDN